MVDNKSTFPIKLTIRIIIEKDFDNEFIARSPDFNNVFAGGLTEKEALKNFKVAFKSYIAFLIRHNKAISCIPKDKKIKNQVIEEIEISSNPNFKSLAYT